MLQLGIFPEVFYINLDSRPDRCAEVEAELASVGLSATRVPGVRLEPYDEPVLRQLGCKLSHLKIFLDARKRGLSCVLIVEDDVKFATDFAAAAAKATADLKNVDWDLFYFGWESFNWKHGEVHPVTENLGRMESAYMTHCYAVSASGFEKYIDRIFHCPFDQTVDSIPVFNANHFRVYCSIRKLARQRESFSDIDQKIHHGGRG